MRRRILSSAVVVTGMAFAIGLAGCGGSDSAATTAATGSSSTTAPLTSTAAAATTAPRTSSTASAGLTASRDLPPQDAVAGVKVGKVSDLPTAKEFVDTLYAASDSGKPAAQKRFEGGGYSGGILRDQVGEKPETGLTLLRTYAIRLRDAEAAQKEVDAGAEEITRTTQATTDGIDVSGIPGARGLKVTIDQEGTGGSVLFVTFAAGSDVFGLQGVSKHGAALPQNQIVGAARDLYEKVTAAP